MAYGVNASVAGISVVFAMAWISGFLRGYVRLFLVRKFGLDDWLALASLVSIRVLASLTSSDHSCYWRADHLLKASPHRPHRLLPHRIGA